MDSISAHKSILRVMTEVRVALLRAGASISHHHGVGKQRKVFMASTQTPLGIQIMKKLKKVLDPNNIFAANNSVYWTAEDENAEIENKKEF